MRTPADIINSARLEQDVSEINSGRMSCAHCSRSIKPVKGFDIFVIDGDYKIYCHRCSGKVKSISDASPNDRDNPT